MANKAVVIGAGIAGLTLARRLREAGKGVTLLEKSRGVGGRLATRREGIAAFDHGAQFYRPSRDTLFHEEWRERGVSEPWFERAGTFHFSSPGGITRLAKALCATGEVQLNTKALRLVADQTGWLVKCDTSEAGGDSVYLTCPLPQSLDLLRESGLPYPAELEAIQYSKAVVGLFELEGSGKELAALDFHEKPGLHILSIANQQSKKVSPVPALTMVMNPEWSEENFERPDTELLPLLLAGLEEYLARNFPEAKVIKASLKKWRYCEPLRRHPAYYTALEGKIFLLGDAFGGGSIAGAMRSAMAVPI